MTPFIASHPAPPKINLAFGLLQVSQVTLSFQSYKKNRIVDTVIIISKNDHSQCLTDKFTM